MAFITLRGSKKELKCPACGGDLEDLQPDEFACKKCWLWFKIDEITKDEMIEWFAMQ